MNYMGALLTYYHNLMFFFYFSSIFQVEVEKNVKFVTFAINEYCKELSDGEDGYILHEANDMLIELEQLSSALVVR